MGIIATGDTLAEALSWVAKGMFSVIAELENVKHEESLEVSIHSADHGAVTVDWLNELLYFYETQDFLPKEFLVTVDESGTSLKARCLGERVDPRRHRILASVKAATYHNLEVIQHRSQWRIQVILDV